MDTSLSRFGLLIVISLLLSVIYSIGLLSRSVWYDEAIALQSLSAMRYSTPDPGFVRIELLKPFVTGVATLGGVVRHYVETDVHPPLYFIVAHAATLVLGNELTVVRGVSLALVAASVFVYGRTVERVFGRQAWIYVVVYGLSFAAVTTAQDARGYALILLLVILAWRLLALAPLAAREGRGVGSEIALGLCCGGLMLTHYFSLFVVAPLLGWRIIEALRLRDPIGLVAPAVCAAAFAPWLPVMLDHLGARPDQMAGFEGVLEWLARVARLTPGQVFSATHPSVPGVVQTAGRMAVLVLAAIGAVNALVGRDARTTGGRMGRIAVWSLGAGLASFLVASVALDRWFDAMRYFLFFAPFVAFLAARGAILVGQWIARAASGRRGLAVAPAAALAAAQLSMANFGWEANRNRGGAYFDSIATQLTEAGPERSLAVIDVGRGRGTLLSAAQAFRPDAEVYLLDPDETTWDSAAAEIAPRLAGRRLVVLAYTIERGAMGSDKAQLYGSIVSAVEQKGFRRVAAQPEPYAGGHYAKWVRADADD